MVDLFDCMHKDPLIDNSQIVPLSAWEYFTKQPQATLKKMCETFTFFHVTVAPGEVLYVPPCYVVADAVSEERDCFGVRVGFALKKSLFPEFFNEMHSVADLLNKIGKKNTQLDEIVCASIIVIPASIQWVFPPPHVFHPYFCVWGDALTCSCFLWIFFESMPFASTEQSSSSFHPRHPHRDPTPKLILW